MKINKTKTIYFLALWLFPLFSLAQHDDYGQLSAEQFHQKILTTEGVLLDVRTPAEYEQGYIEDAGNLNYYLPGFKKRLQLLPQDTPIYVYCNTGYRSEKAAKWLAKYGYTQVFNLQHGILDWYLHDLPVLVDPSAKLDKTDQFTMEDFEQLIASESPVLIDFYAPWCSPCLQMMPMIDSLKVDLYPAIHVTKVNVDASRQLTKELGLLTVPMFRLYKKGEMKAILSGKQSKESLLLLVQDSKVISQ